MSVQENLELIKRYVEKYNSHDLQVIDNLRSDDYTTVHATGRVGPLNKEESLVYEQNFHVAFPDIHLEGELAFAQEDFVVLNWITTGTHKGPMATPTGMPVPATNCKMRLRGSTTYQVKDGRFVRAWIYWDQASLLGQLGLLPSMEGVAQSNDAFRTQF